MSIFERNKTLVLGIGNILLGDEGIGVRVVEQLQNTNLKKQADLIDGGTAGADLLDVIADRHKVIVVDATDAGAEPGTIFRLLPEDIESRAEAAISLHDVGIAETLLMTRQLGCEPDEVVIFGVQPKDISCSTELSPPIRAVIHELIDMIKHEISGN